MANPSKSGLRPKLVVSGDYPDSLDLIGQVEQRIDNLSRSEKAIARLLIKDPAAFSRMGIRDVAAQANVSDPTVVRFCRNVGCDGFKKLKFRLVQDVAVRQAVQDALASSHVAQEEGGDPVGGSVGATVEQLCNDAVSALMSAKRTLDPAMISGAANAIAKANKSLVYGLGGSSGVMARELGNRLFRLGVTCIAHVDSYVQRMSAATLQDGDVAVFLSSTGRPRPLLDAVELAKYYGAVCVGFTPKKSTLGKEMDFCLDVRFQSGVEILQPIPMRFAQLLAIDVVSYEVAKVLGGSALEQLKRTRASIAFLHGLVPQQPVGD